MSRVLTNGPGHRGSISGRVIPKTQKMVLDTALINAQHYKVMIKGKVEQSRKCVAYYNHNDINNNGTKNKYSNTNTGELCCSGMNGFINF